MSTLNDLRTLAKGAKERAGELPVNAGIIEYRGRVGKMIADDIPALADGLLKALAVVEAAGRYVGSGEGFATLVEALVAFRVREEE